MSIETCLLSFSFQEELSYLKRTGVGSVAGDGPPKWVPFGQKLGKDHGGGNRVKADKNGVKGDNEAAVNGDDSEFAAQRKDAIEGKTLFNLNTLLKEKYY